MLSTCSALVHPNLDWPPSNLEAIYILLYHVTKKQTYYISLILKVSTSLIGLSEFEPRREIMQRFLKLRAAQIVSSMFPNIVFIALFPSSCHAFHCSLKYVCMFGLFPSQRGGGGRDTLIFSSYVGSGPASTFTPQKYQEFQVPPIFF